MNKKSINLLIVIALLLGAVALSTSPAQATTGAGAIWTTNGDCNQLTQDENHYAKGSTVYIHGENFDAGTYDWFIIGQPGKASDDPNIKVSEGSYEVDESGSFCFAAYQVKFDDGGEYKANFDGKQDNYRVERGAASVSLSVGECEYPARIVETRSVNLVLNGASLTIEGITYTSSTTIYLEPGSYNYTWVALPGYTGSGSGTLVVPECEVEVLPASASIAVGECSEVVDRESQTSVSITVLGASLTIDGVSYTSSQTILLSPGSYNYSWQALPGYTGSGSGVLVIADCSTKQSSSVLIEVGECTPDGQGGTYRPVTLTIAFASVTINDTTYTESTVIRLIPGSYVYSWTGEDETSGEGTLEIVKGATCSSSVDPTPTPTGSPATGSSDSPVIYAIIGASALLISGISMILWRKKLA